MRASNFWIFLRVPNYAWGERHSYPLAGFLILRVYNYTWPGAWLPHIRLSNPMCTLLYVPQRSLSAWRFLRVHDFTWPTFNFDLQLFHYRSHTRQLLMGPSSHRARSLVEPIPPRCMVENLTHPT
jgi:hypothetical protein